MNLFSVSPCENCRKIKTKKRTPQIQGKALTGTDSNQETNTSKEVLELRVDEAALSEYVGKPVAWSTETGVLSCVD